MPTKATRQIIVNTASGTAISTSSSWIPTNHFETPFNVGFGVIVHGGDVTYRVEHTFDNVLAGASARVFTHDDVSAENAAKDGNYAFPVEAVRLAVVSASGSAGAELTLIQTGV